MQDGQAIQTFVAVVREYCAWCEESRSADPRALHFQATRLLARLYASTLDLPDVDPGQCPDALALSDESRWATFRSFSVLPFHYYREVFDPSVEREDEPVVGDVADDLTDIYADLYSGLALFEQGNEAAAVWDWRFSFGIHWGRHATSALRALHCYKFSDEDSPPSTFYSPLSGR